jgi:outer membrane protein OmpA-like peptidoglycan-associated protein
MKHQESSEPSYKSPYEKRHPLWKRWLTFMLLLPIMGGAFLILFPFDHFGKEYGPSEPYLVHNSQPKTKTLNLRGINVNLQEPVDNRNDIHANQLLMHKIQIKMNTDMTYYGAIPTATDKNLVIKTTVDEFYNTGKGYCWKQDISRVGLDITAALNDSVIVSKKYHIRYGTGGLDKDFEGSIISDGMESMLAVTGVALRKTLDQFYEDLARGLAKEEVMQMHNVLFLVGTTDFEKGTETNLLAVADIMKHDPRMIIELDGYTDNRGDLLKDKALSLNRAKTVKAYLVHQGIKSRRIKTKAFGATKPVSRSYSEDARRLNRRVEFVVIRS